MKTLFCLPINIIAASAVLYGGTLFGQVTQQYPGQTASDYAQIMKDRRAKGDTLAMPYAQLQKYLPQSVSGYTAGKPDGASVNMGQASYSTATIKFTNGNDWVKVAIVDYNQAYGMYASLTSVWAMGMSVDSPQEKADGIKLDNNVGGWEDYKKNNKEAIITLGVGSRFLVSVDASNQTDTEFAKSIAKSIDLSKLAGM